MSYLILYILLAVMVLPGFRINKQNASEIRIDSAMNQLNHLRFLFAVLIVFTHCTLNYDSLPPLLIPLRKVSTFGVGFFFTLSGYGLAYSVGRKPDYLSHFHKKILNLVWITAFASILSQAIIAVTCGLMFTLSLVNWYMPALIGLYCIFYAAYKVFSADRVKRFAALCILTLLIITIMCIIDNLTVDSFRNYYISELAFPFGAGIYEYRTELENYIKKNSSLAWILLMLAIFFAVALIVPEKSFWDLLFHNLMLVPFGLFFVWICARTTVGNAFLAFMNKHSLYVYLFQFAAMTIVNDRYVNSDRQFDVFYFVLCLMLTCVLSLVIHYSYDFLSKGIKTLAKR